MTSYTYSLGIFQQIVKFPLVDCLFEAYHLVCTFICLSFEELSRGVTDSCVFILKSKCYSLNVLYFIQTVANRTCKS